MAELVYATDLKSVVRLGHVGSSPTARILRPHRLVWSRTSGFHPDNASSNLAGVNR